VNKSLKLRIARKRSDYEGHGNTQTDRMMGCWHHNLTASEIGWVGTRCSSSQN